MRAWGSEIRTVSGLSPRILRQRIIEAVGALRAAARARPTDGLSAA
jgi:hypothetical protein